MSNSACSRCAEIEAAIQIEKMRAVHLEEERDQLHAQLREAMNLVALQGADLERYKKAFDSTKPNQPERVPQNQLQLAFERVLESIQDSPKKAALLEAISNEGNETHDHNATGEKKKRSQRPTGRRRLDLTNLPTERVVIDPDEVVAAAGEGFEHIGDETSSRIAFRPASYVRIEIVRRKWREREEASSTCVQADAEECDIRPLARILAASLPESVWPGFMADPSAIAQVIMSKYDYVLPLYRQERMSKHQGFKVPRSTQCSWLEGAYSFLHRITDAMFDEAKANAFCIATDATGAPVRAVGGRRWWHMFVFIADNQHVIFRHTRKHTSESITDMLKGFKGHVLADASLIYDTLFRDHGMTEVGCWYHQRRYFWRALASEPSRAYEALALISKLFKAERACRDVTPTERAQARREKAKPILDAFDDWIARNRDHVDPRGPLEAAIGYYDNQRAALHRFLEDGRLRIDNNPSEQQLRNLGLGRNNWGSFENETGLRWYAVFRSLIASCGLHDLNPQVYLQEILRLVPHWPAHRVIELSPKYWRITKERLDDRHRAILEPPWEHEWPRVSTLARRSKAA